MQYCSLHHQTLLPSPVTFIIGWCCCFCSISSFFLELFLHWSPVAYWTPTDLRSSTFQCPIFLPFHDIHGVLKARRLKWFAIPFSSGPRFARTLCHDLSILGGLHGMAHSFIELGKAVVHAISLVSFLWLWFHSVSPLMEKNKRLLKLPDGRDWLRGKLGFVLMGKAMLSKPLIQFSVEGWGCVPSCYLIWGQTMVEVMKIIMTSFKRSHASTVTLSAPNPVAGHSWPTPLLETPGHSQASLGQSLMCSLLLFPGSWCTQGFVCSLQESVSPVLCKFWWLYGGLMVTSSKRSTAPRAPAPAAGHCWPISLQETLKHSSGSVSGGSLGPGVYRVC